MKLFETKAKKEEREAQEKEQKHLDAIKAFYKRRKMLGEVVAIEDPWERWQYIYNGLKLNDLVLILMLLLFFGDMPEEGKVEDDTRL